jgi:hypothetical protein
MKKAALWAPFFSFVLSGWQSRTALVKRVGFGDRADKIQRPPTGAQ